VQATRSIDQPPGRPPHSPGASPDHAQLRPHHRWPWFAALCLTLLGCLPLPTHAENQPGPLAVGVGLLGFTDERLDAIYGTRITPCFTLQTRPWHGFSPTLAFQVAWRRSLSQPRAFVSDGELGMTFVPVSLEMPYAHALGPGWKVCAGPRLSWAWMREEWRAAVPEAGIAASGHGTGLWLGLGVVLQLWTRLGGAGWLGVAGDWSWAAADRETVRGNPAQEEELTGGWGGGRLLWSPPWPFSF